MSVQEPVGDLVLTTGLPAAALQAGLGEATRAVRRWRQRQIGTGVVALIVVAALVWARLPDGDGDATAASDPDEIEVDEEGVVEEDGTPVPIAADDAAATPIATPVDIAVIVNDTRFTEETVVVLDQPPTSGDARVEGRVVRYDPDADFVGTDRFTYRLATGEARSDPATIAVQVLPAVQISDVPTPEPRFVEYDLVMQVTLTSPSPETVTVAYTTMGITATEGSDFDAASDVLTFEPGQTLAEFPVRILSDDGIGEGNEVFEVRLSDPTNAIVDPEEGVGTVTIIDFVPDID